MKNKRPAATSKPAPATAVRASGLPWWQAALALCGAAVIVLWCYGPALDGPFLFDDLYLPFLNGAQGRPSFLGVRPLTMLSFWVGSRLSGPEPYAWHLLNVLLHILSGGLAFLIVRRILTWNKVEDWRRGVLASFAAGLFLLHPVQTEAVSYISSRSEALSVFFCYAALVLFLYRRPGSISWGAALGVVLLFGCAVLSKEHAAALLGLLLLTDYYWNPGFTFQGIRANWRLYLPLLVAGAAAGIMIRRVLRGSLTAGFGLKDFTWQQYLYTQFRAVWVYLRLFVLPFGQNIDYGYPVSRSLLDRGAVLGLVVLILAIGLALYYRRRWPLASYGLLAFLVLLSPTSSVVPIQDPVAERRLYLPMIGLLILIMEPLVRWRPSRNVAFASFGAVLLVMAFLTYQRNQVWSSALALWEDSIKQEPQNWRAHFQLGFALYQAGRCEEAVAEYEKSSHLKKPDERLYVDWALAYDCAGKEDAALQKLQLAASQKASAHVYSQIGMIYGKQGKREEAIEALQTAIRLDPNFEMSYVYLGHVHAMAHEYAGAAAEYRHALAINPNNQMARDALANVNQALGGR